MSQQAPRTPWLRQTLYLQKAVLDAMLPYGFAAMIGLSQSQTLPAECCRLWLKESMFYSHNQMLPVVLPAETDQRAWVGHSHNRLNTVPFLSVTWKLSLQQWSCFVTTNYQTPLLKSRLDLQETLSKQAPEVATNRDGPDLSQHIREKRDKANFIHLTFLLTSSSSSALMHDGSFSKGLTKGDDCLASGLKFGDKVIFATDGPPWELMESSER